MENRWFWIFFGILSLVGGILALANPFAATLAAETLVGYLFVVAGIGWVISSMRETTWSARIWSVLTGLAHIWLGISLLVHPLAGVLTLTVLVAVMLAVQGGFKFAMALSMRAAPGFWFLLLSAALSVILAVMILFNLLQSAASVLGILLGIELISNGLAMFVLARSANTEDSRNDA